MKYTLSPLALLVLTLAGAQAIADDAPTARPNMTNAQMMKQCMSDERANNSGASVAQLKSTCKAKLKSYQQHPSVTVPSQAPTH